MIIFFLFLDGLSGPSHMTAFEYNFEIDLEKIENGSDRRTTCMIRNIPNKYTQVRLNSGILFYFYLILSISHLNSFCSK